MITIIGIKHDLQFEQNNIDKVAVKTQRKNARMFLSLLQEIIQKDNLQFAGEEAGPGMFLNEFIKKRYGCDKTYLQETISKGSGVSYFQFDLPRDQLPSFEIKPTLNEVLGKKTKIPYEEREKWFYKIISNTIPKNKNGLVLMGLDHVSSLSLALMKDGYELEIMDATKLPWYRDPQKEALTNFFEV